MATNTTYTKTNNYGLNLYGDNDPADLRDGYNDSMHTLDDTLGKHLNRIETLESTDTHDAEVLKALAGDNTVDAATASRTKWDKAGADAAANAANLAALGANTTASATENKTKWDKAATDATANAANLTALGAGTVQDATANRSKWDGYDTAIKSLQTETSNISGRVTLLEKTRGENILILGDSISYGTGASQIGNSWANRLAAYRGCSVTNLAQNNGGYVNAPSFLSQAQGYTGSKEDVTRILIVGGANDKTHTDGDSLANAISQTFAYLKTNFPNAKIQAIPCLLGFLPASRYHANIWTVITRIEEQAGRAGVEVIPFGWEWLAGNPDWTADYSIHPNDAGNTQLLRIISNAIDGQTVRAQWSGTIAGADNHGTITNGIFRVSGGTVQVTCQMKVVNNHAAYQNFARMPYVASQAMNFYVPNSLGKLVYGTANNTKHTFDVACTTAIANDTEIYFGFSKPVDA